MRLFTSLMAILVISLSLVPCCVVDVNLSSNSTVLVSDVCNEKCCSKDEGKSSSQNNSDKNNSCDICSPFFSCGSCVGFANQTLDNLLPTPIFLFNKSFSSNDENINSEYFNTQWQPPKIS